MKNTICFLILSSAILFFNSCKISTGILKKEGLELVEGTDLLYEVNVSGTTYPFEMNMNHFSDYSISFDWEMGGGRSGTVAMYNEPLKNSYALYNYFSPGYKELKEQTSVWVSEQLFKDAKAGKAMEIDLGQGEIATFKMIGKETYSFGNKGNGIPYNLPVIVLHSEESDRRIWILDDSKNRLIVMMDIEFRIDLKDIKPYE